MVNWIDFILIRQLIYPNKIVSLVHSIKGREKTNFGCKLVLTPEEQERLQKY